MAEAASSPLPSNDASPILRSESPSLSVTPSLALDAVPHLDRSVSTPASSIISTTSLRSRASRLSDGGTTVVRRRGYMRPQGTSFADSARNRDSVMSLGSIAHMQYYFARTGLLDGKGAQLAKEKRISGLPGQDKENSEPQVRQNSDAFYLSSFSLYDGSSNYAVSDPGVADNSLVDSPTDISAPGDLWADGPMMLPPTVSTYKMKPEYSEPLPDMPVLRRELKEALQDACKVIEESQQKAPSLGSPSRHESEANSSNSTSNDGFYEIQGLHILDIITLAIRAAKNYYTAHANPQKLYSIKSEREIRADLYQVLDILKRMASRNFKGGMRLLELTGIITWIEGIDKLLKREEAMELQEAAERESWVWRSGEWAGKEREREWLFMKSFDAHQPSLPAWPERVGEDFVVSEFLRALQDGQRLVKLHNALLSRSKRKFHEIKTWHTDVGKPYRMAENLRYWIKAAELRWDVILLVPVSDVVNDKDVNAWRAFDEAVFRWCQMVRTELVEEWRQEAQMQERKRPPELKVDVPDEPVEEVKIEVLPEPYVATIPALAVVEVAGTPAIALAEEAQPMTISEPVHIAEIQVEDVPAASTEVPAIVDSEPVSDPSPPVIHTDLDVLQNETKDTVATLPTPATLDLETPESSAAAVAEISTPAVDEGIASEHA